jgi:hypothetical protein
MPDKMPTMMIDEAAWLVFIPIIILGLAVWRTKS